MYIHLLCDADIWAQGEITSIMNVGRSFKSSSSTLAAGLELMDETVDELVKNALPQDEQEQELLRQLQDPLCI